MTVTLKGNLTSNLISTHAVTRTDPIAAADRKSMTDTASLGSCPLTLADIQLIPVRYAYVETAPELSALDPRFPTGFRPLGVRSARNGYLYLFHSSAPDILQEFVITEGGAVEKRLWEGEDATRDQRQGISAETAIVVPRRGEIEVLFCETQLTAKKCSMLISWKDYRRQVMRKVSLGGYCVEAGTRHLLPKGVVEENLSSPEPGADPDEEAFSPWYWVVESEAGKPEPFTHRLRAYDKDHAYLVLDDLTGQIGDLLDAWTHLDAAQGDWLAREDARYYSASFIQELIKLDEKTVATYVDAALTQTGDPSEVLALQRIAQASPQQRARVAEFAKEFQAGPLDVRNASFEAVKARRQQNETLAELAQELAVEQDILAQVLEALRKNQNQAEHGSLTGERGIRDFVRVDAMNEYLAVAGEQEARFQREKTAVVASLKTLLPHYHLVGHLYDRMEEDAYLAFLRVDNALLNILNDEALATGDYEFIHSYYFGDLGHQHLVGFDIDVTAYTRSVAAVVNGLKTILNAHDNATAYNDWIQTLSDNPQLRFATLTPVISAELSHRLAQWTPIARQELFRLVEKASGARLHERLQQVFQRMNPGLRAHLLDSQLIYQLDLDIADEVTLNKADSLIRDVEHHALRYEDLRSRERSLDSGRKQSRRALTRSQKRTYDAEVARLRAARKVEKRKVDAARKALERLLPSEDNKYQGILKVGGLGNIAETRAVAAELEELKALRDRSGMKKVFDHARGLIDGGDAMEITNRIGGLGVVSFVGLVSFWGTVEAYLQWDRDKTLSGALSVISGGFGTVGAVASVSTIVASARLNYYYQNVSKADAVLSRLARANVWGGTVAAWGGFFAAGADGMKQLFEVFGQKNSRGSRVGAVVTLAGDSMIVYGSGRMAWTGSSGIYHLLVKRTPGVTWASVHRGMLHLGGTAILRGMNLWLWVGTLVVLTGQYVYNRFKRTELQLWCESSAWGVASKEWSADEQRHQLGKLIYRPELKVMAEREALDGRFRYCALRLSLPGLSGLTADNAKWVVLEQRGVEWSAASEDWQDRIFVEAGNESNVSLRVPLLFDELETFSGLYIAIRYMPDGVNRWLPGESESFHYHIDLREQGNVPHVAANEEKTWQLVPFRDKADERLRPLLINYLPLTPWKDNV